MTERIEKFLQAQNKKTRARLKERLQELKKNPLSGNNIKPLNGYGANIFRIRLGKIRIIYHVGKDQSVEIMDINYRGGIYKS